jgi:hypothetical protein
MSYKRAGDEKEKQNALHDGSNKIFVKDSRPKSRRLGKHFPALRPVLFHSF